MATVLLAIGDSALRRLCEQSLSGAGHATVEITRALELLEIGSRLRGDAVLVDGSQLGRDAVRAGAADYAGRLIGLGVDSPALAATLELPVTARGVADTVRTVTRETPEPASLTLEPGRRVARANGREVALTRSEYQLLETLLGRRGGVVLLDEAMEALWGAGDWSRNLSLLRAHMRNLRLKLAQVGLANAVRSRRGKGYVLAV
ncbi:MAG TPA: winged helix-turn-helix domain-containing protein [Dehalococcoidia bacterium]|nr:winged helix-turn-helix domain-containing protein [Dehalococcoidia bacterium]